MTTRTRTKTKRTSEATTTISTTSTKMKRRRRRITTSNPGADGPDAKQARLFDLLDGLQSVIVAFSGGVDSAYLAWASTEVLGNRAVCITADSPSYPDRHRQLALGVARDFQ